MKRVNSYFLVTEYNLPQVLKSSYQKDMKFLFGFLQAFVTLQTLGLYRASNFAKSETRTTINCRNREVLRVKE